MVIMIGGSSHVGKTLLAQKLLEKYHFPYLSLDHLKMGLIRTEITKLTVEDDYEMRYYLWPIVAEMIKTAIENNQNLIVEGCYIPGQWKESFSEEYLSQIHCAFVVMSEAYIRSNFDKLCSYASVIENRIADEPDEERLIKCSQYFKQDCIDYDIPCVEISDTYDIYQIMEQFETVTQMK